MFRSVVVEPAAGLVGFARTKALISAYVAYAGGTLFQGGCFFAAAVHEFDGRPGAVRDRLVAFLANWNREVREATDQARERKELPAGTDADQNRRVEVQWFTIE
jgi:hypothetical protein